MEASGELKEGVISIFGAWPPHQSKACIERKTRTEGPLQEGQRREVGTYATNRVGISDLFAGGKRQTMLLWSLAKGGR